MKIELSKTERTFLISCVNQKIPPIKFIKYKPTDESIMIQQKMVKLIDKLNRSF